MYPGPLLIHTMLTIIPACPTVTFIDSQGILENIRLVSNYPSYLPSLYFLSAGLACPQTVNSLRIPSLAPLSPRRILHLEHFIQDHGFKNHLYVRTLFFWSGLLSPAPKQHLQLSRHMISSLGRQRYLKLNCLKQKPIPLTALRCLSSPGQQSLPPSTQPLQSFLTPPSLTAHTVTLPPSPGKFPAKVSRTSSIFLLSYMTLP